MPYSRPYPGGFKDYPDTTTPINAATLNTMDVGIKTANDQFQKVTTTERNTLTPNVGQAVWDSDLNQLMVYVNAAGGNAWQPVGNTIVCSSTTRPSTPFEGQMIYETDTHRWLSYSNSAWVSLFDTDVWSIDGDYFQGISSNTSQPRITFYNLTNDAFSSVLYFVKRRGTSTIVNNNDVAGNIGFYGYNGVADTGLARIRAVIDGTPSATSMPGRFEFWTAPDGTTSIVERLRITNSGVLVVGNGETASSPSAGTISGTSGSGTNIGGANLVINGGQGTGTGAGGSFVVQTAPAGGAGSALNALVERFRISASGVATIGNGNGSGTASAVALQSTFGSGTNIAGSDFTIRAGAGTGTGAGGSLLLQTAAAGASGSSLNAYTTRANIDSNGFISVTGSLGRGAPITKTGNFSVAITENWLICNGAASITVTLPTASAWTGREITIKTIAAQTVVSNASNVVPVAGGAAGTAILAATAGKWATLVSDGTNWITMAAA